MEVGDLVNVYPYSPHDSQLSNTVIFHGIFIDWHHAKDGVGWKVFVDGKIETYSTMWWHCKKA